MAQSQPHSGNFGAAAATASNDLQDRVQQLKNKAEDVAGTMASEGKKAYQAAEQTAEDAYDATRRFVREQPVLAVGLAVTAAFAVGALWKLTQSRRKEDLLDRVTNMLEPQYRALRRRF
jgi:ElaB/YqjD/DUF883 family membrane-anchored ribosome-binding protein